MGIHPKNLKAIKGTLVGFYIKKCVLEGVIALEVIWGNNDCCIPKLISLSFEYLWHLRAFLVGH